MAGCFPPFEAGLSHRLGLGLSFSFERGASFSVSEKTSQLLFQPRYSAEVLGREGSEKPDTPNPMGPFGQGSGARSPEHPRGSRRIGGGTALLLVAGGTERRGSLTAQATEAQETKRPK